MKQFFLSAALLVGAALSFSACNNGVYDTDPGASNGGGNPFHSGNGGAGGVTVANGTVQFKANGSPRTYTTAVGALAIGNNMQLSGVSSVAHPIEALGMTINSYTGVATYGMNATGVTMYFSKTTAAGTDFEFNYSGGELSTIKVISVDGNVIKGTFSGKLWQWSGPNVDTMTITEGQFNVTKS